MAKKLNGEILAREKEAENLRSLLVETKNKGDSEIEELRRLLNQEKEERIKEQEASNTFFT